MNPGHKVAVSISWGRDEEMMGSIAMSGTSIVGCPGVVLTRALEDGSGDDDRPGSATPPTVLDFGWKLTHRVTGYALTGLVFDTQLEACVWLERFQDAYDLDWQALETVDEVREAAFAAGMTSLDPGVRHKPAVSREVTYG